ncbi:hypothetical protein FHL15_008971 [Xylaria flabelliformis]|uniref:Heterokaryon incompatibility domain-containing protein n=1 Tax=Xylaria flabelliformis TaxID=2512241 RepID=A0A553HQ24_9PEZI|nr:hypothetical protein FHL15_008971 [Xylaria flabelliformis]
MNPQDTAGASYPTYEMQYVDQQHQSEQPSADPYQQYSGYAYPQHTFYQSDNVSSPQHRDQMVSNPYAHGSVANVGYPIHQQWWEQASHGADRGVPIESRDNNSGVAIVPPEPLAKQQTETENQPQKGGWWPWGKTEGEKINANLRKQFNGQRGFNGHFYYKPTQSPDVEHGQVVHSRPDDYGAAATLDPDGKHIFLNSLGQEHVKYSDVAVYLSPTNFRPKRLVVQSTDYILRNRASQGGDWRRKAVSGNVPTTLRLAEWGLRPFQRSGVWHKINGSLRMLAISVPLQLLLAFPGTSSWDDGDVSENYTNFPNYQWRWPKHAINPLDQRPGSITHTTSGEHPSARHRTVRPRKLYVRQADGSWEVVDNPPKNLQYIFISYAAKSFKIDGGDGYDFVRSMAQEATLRANCTACWVDTDCIENVNGYQKDADIYAMCDVIRGSKRVVVILPDNGAEARRFWGSRMWTLPEALLGPGSEVDFMARVGDGYETKTLSLIEMTGEIWDDSQYEESGGLSTRLLAEHFAGELTLSRIELFVTACTACEYRSRLNYTMFTNNDVTLAVMGLLHYRIDRNDDDTAFQSLAQLSLRNDSDRIIERMVSLLHQTRSTDSLNPFYNLAHKDAFSTRLWDIQPTCYVVGVAYEDNTIMLDSCRVMHIRWKGFPRIAIVRDYSLAKLLATIFVTAGTWWFLQGIYITITYAPFIATTTSTPNLHYYLSLAIAAFFIFAILLSLFGPVSVRRLYGGEVLQSSSNLVGFEGVMPIAKLERIIFGNNNGRLNYEASSTPIGMECRDRDLRLGNEPNWVREGRPEAYDLPEGHRLFTLVDTGTLTVSIFSAERPPTVALLCGREGGMLRAVLCSWSFENNCLYKETVIRMPTNVWDAANLQGWLKICLASMKQQRNIERNKMITSMSQA